MKKGEVDWAFAFFLSIAILSISSCCAIIEYEREKTERLYIEKGYIKDKWGLWTKPNND